MICKECCNELPLDFLRKEGIRMDEALCPICSKRESYCLSVRDLLQNPETRVTPTTRTAQLDISTLIQRALLLERDCIAEAGTGTGKTLAYLLPALALGKRVIVATATKALQDQILLEDGPTAIEGLKRLGFDKNIAVYKGKGNYACRVNYDLAVGKSRITPQEQRAFEDWATQTRHTHFNDLNYYPGTPTWLDGVRLEDCSGKDCKYETQCGYVASRAFARAADVVVTNHSLIALEFLISPAGNEASVDDPNVVLFGRRQAIIFDEAHQLEESFERALRKELAVKDVQRLGKQVEKSPYTRMTTTSTREDSYLYLPPTLFLEILSDLESACKAVLGRWAKTKSFEKDVVAQHTLVLSRLVKNVGRLRLEIAQHLHGVKEDIQREARNSASGGGGGYRVPPELLLEERELRRWLRKVEVWQAVVDAIPSTKEHVTYVDGSEDANPMFVMQPVDMAKLLQPLWATTPSVVFSSATMSTRTAAGSSFDLFQSRLGLDVISELRQSVPSPFDYSKRCITYVTRDRSLRPPKASAGAQDKVDYYDNLAVEVGYWSALTRGHSLVLFASTVDMNEVYARLTADVRVARYPILTQRDASPNQLLETYLEYSRRTVFEKPRRGPILLGLKSFWEGVSLKGPHLVNVIITRVPFPNPTSPLFQKREELLGTSSFQIQSLYPATIAMRQGSGRLLRTTKDAGIVVLLDERLSSSRWGKEVVDSLESTQNIAVTKAVAKQGWESLDAYLETMLDKSPARRGA